MQTPATAFRAGCAAFLILAAEGRAAAAAHAPPSYVPAAAASGKLQVSGADSMYALMDDWAAQFARIHPHASVQTDRKATLSAQGMTALLEGRADIVTFVREPFEAENAAFLTRFGYPLTIVRIAGGSYATTGGTHALAIYVHPSNPLTGLTLAQLDAAFSRSLRRGARVPALTWGDLGATGTWRQRPIHVYGMLTRRESGNPPGIVNYLTRRVLLGGAWRADVREQIDHPGESALEGIVARVADDPEGIGYSGFGYRIPGVKTLALAEAPGGPYYSGRPVDVARQHYPLSRSIYLGVNVAHGKPAPALLREFLRFVLSAEGQNAVALDHMQFIPLDAAQADTARASIP